MNCAPTTFQQSRSLVLSPRLAGPGALVFAAAGAVSGILAFAVAAAGAGTASFVVEACLPWVAGGALLGLWVDLSGGAPD